MIQQKNTKVIGANLPDLDFDDFLKGTPGFIRGSFKSGAFHV